jgi:hypothetical protein
MVDLFADLYISEQNGGDPPCHSAPPNNLKIIILRNFTAGGGPQRISKLNEREFG